jgi:hypothetical protein
MYRATRDLVVCVNGKNIQRGKTREYQRDIWDGRMYRLVTAGRSVLSYRSLLHGDTGRSCVLVVVVIIIIIIIIMCDQEGSCSTMLVVCDAKGLSSLC